MRYLITRQAELFNENFDVYKLETLEFCLNYFKDKSIIGVDTETEGFDPYTKNILTIQLGTPDDQFVIDNTIPLKDITIFNSPDKLFIFHNAKFDLRFLYHKGVFPIKVYDTYLAEKLLYLGYPSGFHKMGLADCTERYLNVKLDKSIRGIIHKEKLSERVIHYAAEDVAYLELIMNAQSELIEKEGLKTAVEIECEFVKALAYVEYSGIHLNVEKWKNKMMNDVIILREAEDALNTWVIAYNNSDFISKDTQGDLFLGFKEAICNINWASPKQVIPFFEALGFNLIIKDKTTSEFKKSVEATIIEPQKHLSEVAQLYLNYKQADKVVSTYGETFLKQINPVTKRIHTQFNQLMDTTRLSSGGKDKSTGVETVNLQNIPSDAVTRGCFTAVPDSVLIDCDFTAQEDLVFTELSQEPKLIEFYKSVDKRDGHSFVAKMCFPQDLEGITEQEVKDKRPDLRKQAKTAKFALHYGGDGSTVARNLSLPIEDGHKIAKAYFNGFPGIADYFKNIKADVWKNGYIIISKYTGHKCFIYDWEELKETEKSFNSQFWEIYRAEKSLNSNIFKDQLQPKVSHFYKRKGAIERMALNYPIQGTSAQITKIATIRLFNYLYSHSLLGRVKICNIIHDELLIECPLDIKDDMAIILQKSMESAGNLFVKSVTLKAIPEISNYWTH